MKNIQLQWQLHKQALLACPLFQSISESDLHQFLQHHRMLVRSYDKDEFIAIASTDMEGIGIVLTGSALLTRENVVGQRVIVTELVTSSMFGEALLFAKRPLWPATIQAKEKSIILFIPLQSFLDRHGTEQSQLIMMSNLLQDVSEKAILLTRKVHYLTLKSMRGKIFAYLMDMYKTQQSLTLTLPHNRQEMADALNVSRTSMSRELGRLQKEGILTAKGKTVIIHQLQVLEDYGFESE